MTISDKDIEESITNGYDNNATIKLYLTRLKTIRDIIIQEKNTSYFKIIANPLDNYVKIREYYPNLESRKAHVSCILVIFKMSPFLKEELKEDYEQWCSYFKNINYLIEKKQLNNNIPDEKKLLKYSSFEDMELKYKELSKSKKQHQTLKDSQAFILLSIIVHTPPKRSDYGSMKIYYNSDPNDESSNYMVLNNIKTSYFVFNQYKTKKKYGRIDQDLPQQCVEDIKKSIRIYERSYLFINSRSLEPFEKRGSFSSYVTRTFEYLFGRATGTSLLRHIYITEKVNTDTSNPIELGHLANQMMHSVSTQRKYKWDKKQICEQLCSNIGKTN